MSNQHKREDTGTRKEQRGGKRLTKTPHTARPQQRRSAAAVAEGERRTAREPVGVLTSERPDQAPVWAEEPPSHPEREKRSRRKTGGTGGR